MDQQKRYKSSADDLPCAASARFEIAKRAVILELRRSIIVQNFVNPYPTTIETMPLPNWSKMRSDPLMAHLSKRYRRQNNFLEKG